MARKRKKPKAPKTIGDNMIHAKNMDQVCVKNTTYEIKERT